MIAAIFFHTILPVYFLIAAGFAVARFTGRSDTSGITLIVLYVLAPCLILSSFRKAVILPGVSLCTAIPAVVVAAGTLIAAFTVEKLVFKKRFPAFELSSTMMNSGYLGLPLIYLLYGEGAVAFAVFFMVFMTIIHFTVGIMLLQSTIRDGIKEIFKLPLIYAIAVAFCMKGVSLPSGFEKMISLAGNATIPVMLVTVGMNISSMRTGSFKPALSAVLIRFFGGFLFSTLTFHFLPCDTLVRNVVVVQSSLPPAILNFVLCDRFRQDPEIASTSIVTGTVLSPLWIAVVAKWLS